MSSGDSKGSGETKIIKFDGEDDSPMKRGKPCIDFQPDDRWQIKDEAHENVEKVKRNLKSKEVQNSSNGRTTRSLRSRTNQSTVNGNASSDENEDKDSESSECSKAKPSETVCNNKGSSKRKRPPLKHEAKAETSSVSNKKAKIDVENDDNENEKNDNENDVEMHDESSGDEKKKDTSSNENNDMPSLAKSEISIVEKVTELGSPNESIDKESKDSNDSTKDSIEKNNEEDSACPPNLDDFSPSEASSNEKEGSIKNGDTDTIEVLEKESTKDSDHSRSDIEVINLDESKRSSDNSDEESDSEIQIINAESEVKSVLEFPPVRDTTENISMSAGFPYFNSLKEKISGFNSGAYKPVKFPHTGTLLLAKNEVIIESPSLLVPLLIKEADEFPTLEGAEEKKNGEEPAAPKTTISKRNFFQSSVGQFLINLGMSRVQEWFHGDLKRWKQKQLRKAPESEEVQKAIKFHSKRQEELKTINAIFNFRMRRCQFCDFKTESRSVMEGHYLIPHLSPRREYKCNFCAFMSRDQKEITFHYEAMHNKEAIFEATAPLHECIFCSFSSTLKTKVSVHMNRCRKHFIPSQNLSPPFDFEFPGVTTKPVTIADVDAHRRLLQSSAKNQRLPFQDDTARKKLASVLSRLSGQGAYPDMKNPNIMKQLMSTQTQQQLTALSATGIQLPPGIVITRPRLQAQQVRPGTRLPNTVGIRYGVPRRAGVYANNITSTATQLASSGISITPVNKSGITAPRMNSQGLKNVTLTPISSATNRNVSQKPGPPQPVALFTNVASTSSMMGQPQARIPLSVTVRATRPLAPYQRLNTPPSQVVKGSSGNTFVMCEICDSYIKDLEELRSHMNWVHKVKIHPKMLVSRPPLNCQKCQWRFFTDQGLERHLLGAHGLVTTNMQEMANKNQDGGRCIICGAVFTYKLVSHMTQVHKVTLKPAHLSYKCTVCTATFTLYRLFESHVYNVHSGSAKRPSDDAPSPTPVKRVARPEYSDSPRRCKDCNLVTSNMHDHLVKMHLKKSSVKLCRIDQCKKCLYSSDEMIVFRLSDLGMDEDSDESSEESSSPDDDDDDDSNEDDNADDKA